MPERLAKPLPNPAWSLLRCVFALQICLVHLASPVWNRMEEGWIGDTAFMALARTGTLGFMMLAGAILIARAQEQAGPYLLHRLRRWLPMLLFAQLLYLALALWLEGETPASLGWSDLIEPAWYHIWFFYALGLIYLVVVPMRAYAAWAENLGGAARLAAIWAPVAALFAGLAVFTAVFGFWGDLRPVNLVVYCGFAWTGYALATSFPKGTLWGAPLLLAGVAGATLATAAATEAAGVPVKAYFHRCSIFVALAACGQFLLLLRAGAIGWSRAATGRVNALAALTLGIFVVHPLLIALAGWPPGWAAEGWHKLATLPAAAALLFTASAALTWLWLRAGTLLQRPSARPAATPSTPGFRPASPRHPR